MKDAMINGEYINIIKNLELEIGTQMGIDFCVDEFTFAQFMALTKTSTLQLGLHDALPPLFSFLPSLLSQMYVKLYHNNNTIH